MTSLAQDKALHIIFCEPISEGLWLRVFNKKLTDNDVICDDFHYVNHDAISSLVKDLSINFQEMFDAGYLQGVNLMKGQSVK